MFNQVINPVTNSVLPRNRRFLARPTPQGPPPRNLSAPPSTPPGPPRNDSPASSSVAMIGSSPLSDEFIEAMDLSGKFSSAPSTPTPKAKAFIAASGKFTTNLPMPSLNSNIGLSPPIKSNKRRKFDEYSIQSQEVINRTKSIQLLNTAKNALLESFVLDQNPETAIFIDNINSLLTKKTIKPKATLEMIDWKLNRVLEQTSKIPETTEQSVRPTQANSNGNSNLTKNVKQAIRRGTAEVPGPQVNESTKTWSQMLGRATANSENWTTVSRTKKSNTNSNSNKFDNTDDFNAIKSRRLIITPKAQIGDIDSLLLRNQINSLFKDAKLTIVVNTVEKSKTGQNIVLTTNRAKTLNPNRVRV